MKRLVAALAAAFAIAFGLAAPSLALTLPPTREGVYVYDLAHIWSQSAIDQAQATAAAIRQRTQAQIAVVSWPTGESSVSTEQAKVDARQIMDTWIFQGGFPVVELR